MKCSSWFLLCLALLVCASVSALAQEGPLVSDPPKDITAEEIIKRFAAKEAEFAKADQRFVHELSLPVLPGIFRPRVNASLHIATGFRPHDGKIMKRPPAADKIQRNKLTGAGLHSRKTP